MAKATKTDAGTQRIYCCLTISNEAAYLLTIPCIASILG